MAEGKHFGLWIADFGLLKRCQEWSRIVKNCRVDKRSQRVVKRREVKGEEWARIGKNSQE